MRMDETNCTAKNLWISTKTPKTKNTCTYRNEGGILICSGYQVNNKKDSSKRDASESSHGKG